MQVSFELARLWDQELLLQFIRELRECDPDEGAFDESAARNAIPAMISDPSVGRIWLIKVESETVGYIAMTLGYSIEFGGRIAFVDELYIAPQHRRQGIGSLALEFVEQKAAALDVRTLLLEVTQNNAAARALYRNKGYADRAHRLMTKRIGQ